MAYEISNYSVKVTLVAGADLSALQYTFVKLDSSGQAVAAGSGGTTFTSTTFGTADVASYLGLTGLYFDVTVN